MKNLKALLLTFLLIAIATPCTHAQKNVITSKTYPVSSFSSIESDAVADVIYTQSNNVSVRAEGDKELVDNLKVSVKNNVLKLDHSGKLDTQNKKPTTLYISSPTIEEIEVEGVGYWKLEGKVNATNLKIEFEGVGNFEAHNLETNNLKAKYEGVGNFTLGGTTNFLELKTEGVGKVDTHKLLAKTVRLSCEGVGSVACYASESIEIKNKGVGSVIYYGNPKIKNLDNSAVGKIKEGK